MILQSYLKKVRRFNMCHKENCTQCVIDEVDTKLEDLLWYANLHEVTDMRDQILAIRDEIRPLISC